MPLHDALAAEARSAGAATIRELWCPTPDLLDQLPRGQRLAIAEPFVERATFAPWSRLKSGALAAYVRRVSMREAAATWVPDFLRFAPVYPGDAAPHDPPIGASARTCGRGTMSRYGKGLFGDQTPEPPAILMAWNDQTHRWQATAIPTLDSIAIEGQSGASSDTPAGALDVLCSDGPLDRADQGRPVMNAAAHARLPRPLGRFLRIADVVAATGLSRPTILKQHALTERCVGWWETDVASWLDQRLGARPT